MEIPKIGLYLSDKIAPKMSYFQKTAIFLKKMAESKHLLFFGNNSF